MAKRDEEEEGRRRRREREEEAEEEERQALAKKTGKPVISDKDSLTEKIDELIRRAEPMIEQVNALYNMYMSGAETRPPLERRKQLELVMEALQGMGGVAIASYQFRFRSTLSSYIAHRDRWDKLLRDLEAGKIQRTGNPKRK
jgi:hypothetical protein